MDKIKGRYRLRGWSVKSTGCVETKCFCGHWKRDHRLYVGKGANRKGGRYVCTKDGCSLWDCCDIGAKRKAVKVNG
jgi:hypothetical protein